LINYTSNLIFFFLAVPLNTSKTTAKQAKTFPNIFQQHIVADIFDEGQMFKKTSDIDALNPLNPPLIVELYEKEIKPKPKLFSNTPSLIRLGKRRNESVENAQPKESPRKKQKQNNSCCTYFTQQDLEYLNLESWS